MIKLQWRRAVGFFVALASATALLVAAGLAEDAGASAPGSATVVR